MKLFIDLELKSRGVLELEVCIDGDAVQGHPHQHKRETEDKEPDGGEEGEDCY